MSKGNVLLGIVSGLAVGALLGVLFAPAEGSETRQKLADKGADLSENLKRKFDEFIDDLTGVSARAGQGETDSQNQ